MLNSNEVVPLLVPVTNDPLLLLSGQSTSFRPSSLSKCCDPLGYLFPYHLLPNSILMALNTFLKSYYDSC